MTDDTETTDDERVEEPQEQTAEAATDDPSASTGQEPQDAEADVVSYLMRGTLVLLVVLGVVATLQFYLSAQTAVRRFASDEFRPLFVAAFNLVVLFAVGVGIAQTVRRLR